jgi:hypothetical protein
MPENFPTVSEGAFSEVRRAEREGRGRLVTPARMCSQMWSGNYPPSALLHDVADVSALAQIFSASSRTFSSERSVCEALL